MNIIATEELYLQITQHKMATIAAGIQFVELYQSSKVVRSISKGSVCCIRDDYKYVGTFPRKRNAFIAQWCLGNAWKKMADGDDIQLLLRFNTDLAPCISEYPKGYAYIMVEVSTEGAKAVYNALVKGDEMVLNAKIGYALFVSDSNICHMNICTGAEVDLVNLLKNICGKSVKCTYLPDDSKHIRHKVIVDRAGNITMLYWVD